MHHFTSILSIWMCSRIQLNIIFYEECHLRLIHNHGVFILSAQVLKAVVAQFNASQLITQRAKVTGSCTNNSECRCLSLQCLLSFPPGEYLGARPACRESPGLLHHPGRCLHCKFSHAPLTVVAKHIVEKEECMYLNLCLLSLNPLLLSILHPSLPPSLPLPSPDWLELQPRVHGCCWI